MFDKTERCVLTALCPMIAQNSQPGSRKSSTEEAEGDIGLSYTRVQDYK